MKHSPFLAVVALLAFACTGTRSNLGPPSPWSTQCEPDTIASPRTAAPVTGWISVRDIMFDLDTAEIRPSERSKISDIATYLNRDPCRRVGIDGSTDLLRSTNPSNVALSPRRIANVLDALLRAGVPADRIEIGAFAEERVQCNYAVECAQREGRVEVMGRRTAGVR